MLRREALASSVVASMPTVLPWTKPASAWRYSIQVTTASWVSASIQAPSTISRMRRVAVVFATMLDSTGDTAINGNAHSRRLLLKLFVFLGVMPPEQYDDDQHRHTC